MLELPKHRSSIVVKARNLRNRYDRCGHAGEARIRVSRAPIVQDRDGSWACEWDDVSGLNGTRNRRASDPGLRTKPPLPGSIIRHKIVSRMGLRQSDLARAMGISTVRLNQIINGHAPITPEMALRLGKVTGTEPEYWLSLQSDLDLFDARVRLGERLDSLPTLASTCPMW